MKTMIDFDTPTARPNAVTWSIHDRDPDLHLNDKRQAKRRINRHNRRAYRQLLSTGAEPRNLQILLTSYDLD